MAKRFIQISALDGRIKQGKADPITSIEKRLVAELREGYEKKYGGSKSAKAGRRGSAVASRSSSSSKFLTGRPAADTSKSS